MLLGLGAQATAACEGRLPNLISDVCWSCMFPLEFNGLLTLDNDQLGTETFNQFFCSCDVGVYGVSFGMWEPVRIVEVTRTPYCLVTLNGLQLAAGLPAKEPGMRTGGGEDGTTAGAFYHVHWYLNPLLHWLGLLLDFECIERAGLDLAYLSELDPTWDDDRLAMLLAPETALVGNLAGVASCAADCVATTTGWPQNELWWCAGCTGMLVPPSGNVSAHVSGRQTSALLAARLTARMHRVGATLYTHGSKGVCAGFIAPYLNKEVYKMAMLSPRGQGKRRGRCCEPFGASPELWASGSEWPVTGEDFAYLLFRKRDCCLNIPLN